MATKSVKRHSSDDYNDDDDEDDLAPLVAGSTVSPLEMESLRRKRKQVLEHDNQQTPLIWWVIRTALLAMAALIPFLVGVYYFGGDNRAPTGLNDVDVTWDSSSHDIDSDVMMDAKEDATTAIEIERDPVAIGCEPEQAFNELMKKMEELEQFTDDLCDEERRNQKGDCKCYNPTMASTLDKNKAILRKWESTFRMTRELAANATRELDSLEVVLLGDSITEHWNGSDLGKPYDVLDGIAQVFKSLFRKENGGRVNGVAMGVAAERCANTLYRLQNDGMGSLDPDVWWVLIGTNDIGGDHCSEEAIVSGNINIVQEILSQRPNATVVINSILPRAPPAWDHLVKVNERLSCYAQSTKQVEFFNATDIFLLENQTLVGLTDGVHPSAEGSQRWGEAIVDKVMEVVANRIRPD